MAKYTLEVIYPRPVGAAGSGLSSTNRCYFAYTGLTYSIQVSARGGDYPYTYALSNAPAGMAVDTAGVVTWTNPTSTATDVQVTVTDASLNTDSATWTITVGTSGWFFVDAVGGSDAAAGTLAAPWQTLDKVYDSSGANSRIYFRTGTYTLAGITVENADDVNGEERVVWAQGSQGTTWIAYPGESPVVDFEYVGTGAPYNTGDSVPRIRISGASIYIDGIAFIRSMTMGFQLESRTSDFGVQFRNVSFDDHGPGIASGNSACIMWVAGSNDSYGDIVTGCSFDDIQYGGDNCALKIYGVRAMLVHGCTFGTMSTGGEGILAIKGLKLQDGTTRACTFEGADTAIGGNFASTPLMTWEFCYNNVKSTSTAGERGALSIGGDKVTDIGALLFHRNTFRGQISINNVVTADGVYTFTNNVIINADGAGSPWPYVADAGISDSSRVSIPTSATPTGTQNLAGAAADGIVDATGLLQGSYRTSYFPGWGHEIDTNQSVVQARRRFRRFRLRAA